MLLAVTSIMTWWLFRPPMALNMERSTVFLPGARTPPCSCGRPWPRSGCPHLAGGSLLDPGDVAEGERGAALQRELGAVGRAAGGGDDGRLLGAVAALEGHRLADHADGGLEVLAQLERVQAARQLRQLLDGRE